MHIVSLLSYKVIPLKSNQLWFSTEHAFLFLYFGVCGWVGFALFYFDFCYLVLEMGLGFFCLVFVGSYCYFFHRLTLWIPLPKSKQLLMQKLRRTPTQVPNVWKSKVFRMRLLCYVPLNAFIDKHLIHVSKQFDINICKKAPTFYESSCLYVIILNTFVDISTSCNTTNIFWNYVNVLLHSKYYETICMSCSTTNILKLCTRLVVRWTCWNYAVLDTILLKLYSNAVSGTLHLYTI